MFTGPTKYAADVDWIMYFIVISSSILLLGITAAMIYFVFKYSRKKNSKPENIHGNTTLEILWIVIPTVLVLFMFYFGLTAFNEFREIPKDALEVTVLAKQWVWEFDYANGKKSDTLYLPVGKSVKFNLTTADVNHGFYLPDFRVKEDIIAGRVNYMVIKPEKKGSYQIMCSQYCGLTHSNMYSRLVVLSEAEFNDWLNKVPADSVVVVK